MTGFRWFTFTVATACLMALNTGASDWALWWVTVTATIAHIVTYAIPEKESPAATGLTNTTHSKETK